MISRLATTARRAITHTTQSSSLLRRVTLPAQCRIQAVRFSTNSAAATKLSNVLDGEIKHEKDGYESAAIIKTFLDGKEWTFEQQEGDVNMSLTKKVGDNSVRVEWQLVSPFDPEMDNEEMSEEMGVHENTDFCIAVENKEGAGMTFYCQTQKEQNHRFVIGSCKAYGSAAERDSVSGYNGPEFEDLDEKMQEAFDEYIGELGLSDPVFDFIDAAASDKEQREYIRWLTITRKFFEK